MLTRNESHTVVLRKEGYTEYRTEIAPEFSSTPFITDLIFWHLFRSKDLSAGAWQLTPHDVYASMEIEEGPFQREIELPGPVDTRELAVRHDRGYVWVTLRKITKAYSVSIFTECSPAPTK